MIGISNHVTKPFAEDIATARQETLEAGINAFHAHAESHVTGRQVVEEIAKEGAATPESQEAAVEAGKAVESSIQRLKEAFDKLVTEYTKLGKAYDQKLNKEEFGNTVREAVEHNPKAALAIIGGSVGLGALATYASYKHNRGDKDRKIGESVRELRNLHTAPGADKSASGKAILGDWTSVAEERLLNAHETGQIR
tara:strand:- start:158 stop:745 length:588 start_codon:yes stop_codon:yes gene_type:complete